MFMHFQDILLYKGWGRFSLSNCGHHKGEMKLSEREWICTNCSTKHDRDWNAAQNIRNFGLSKSFRVGTYPLRAKTSQ